MDKARLRKAARDRLRSEDSKNPDNTPGPDPKSSRRFPKALDFSKERRSYDEEYFPKNANYSDGKWTRNGRVIGTSASEDSPFVPVNKRRNRSAR